MNRKIMGNGLPAYQKRAEDDKKHGPFPNNQPINQETKVKDEKKWKC